MDKLFTTNAAILYLRERVGSMSRKTFLAEVAAGRIPVKPYGAQVRFRKQDLDTWLNITETHHSDFTNAAKRGTPTFRSALMESGLSFVKRQGVQMKQRRRNIA